MKSLKVLSVIVVVIFAVCSGAQATVLFSDSWASIPDGSMVNPAKWTSICSPANDGWNGVSVQNGMMQVNGSGGNVQAVSVPTFSTGTKLEFTEENVAPAGYTPHTRVGYNAQTGYDCIDFLGDQGTEDWYVYMYTAYE